MLKLSILTVGAFLVGISGVSGAAVNTANHLVGYVVNSSSSIEASTALTLTVGIVGLITYRRKKRLM